MNSKPEDWTAIQTITQNWDADDWQKLKYEVKIGLTRSQRDEDFTMIDCDGKCGYRDYKVHLIDVIVNGKKFFVCGQCYDLHMELQKGDDPSLDE